MADIDPDYDKDEEERRRRADEEERRRQTPPTTDTEPPPPPSQTPNEQWLDILKRDPHAEGPGVNEMIARDRGSWEQRLRAEAATRRVSYDPSDLEDVIRQVSYARNWGRDPADFLNQKLRTFGERAVNVPGGVQPPSTQPPPTQPPPTPGPVNDPRHVQFPPQDHNVFDDALTRQLEQLAQQQMASYQHQQAMLQQYLDPLIQQQQQLVTQQQAQYAAHQTALEDAAKAAEQRRAATGAATDRLTGYLNERVGKLQGPAYTGTEQEVLRTQLLDPLERDRTAAQKRAVEQISSRGYELDSGVAQELLAQVDRAFNEQRTSAQGGLAQRQIEEQRSREQEAQELLQYLAALPDAAARGDLEYVTYVQNLLNQPRQASLATGMAGGTGVAQLMDLPNQPGMQGLGIAELLADLPTKRLNDALATLGIGGTGSGATSSLIQLLQNQQQNRAYTNANTANYWANIGRSVRP